MVEIPKILINPKVRKLIGISKLRGAAIKLYAYKMKAPTITFLTNEKNFFSTFVHLIQLYEVCHIL